ncbi:Uncharacterized protein SCF082_LOCUS34940 [Durusdinium trenchii]|uniref:Uncharacterized protein n=1 Tax=Durusdinium trenchii TaxID=1381693 RepID=A0ABP0P349_9DINO
MKFRVEVNVGPKESIQLETTTESGLEQPEVFWVELDEYIKTYGEPDQADIVQEIVKGVTKLGVKRKAELTDEINIDTSGHAYDQIEAQAKKTSLRDTSKVVYMGDADGEEGVEDEKSDAEDSDEQPCFSMLSFLKQRAGKGGGKAKAAGKALPKAKAAAAKSHPRALPTSAPQTKPNKAQGKIEENLSTEKIVIGNASGSGTKRAAAAAGLESAERTVTRAKPNVKSDGLMTGLENLSEADKDAFKSYMTDHCSKISSALNELKGKKKSAGRRKTSSTGETEFIAEMEKLENRAKDVLQALKCF